MMFRRLTYFIFFMGLFACKQEAPDANAVARVNDKYLSQETLKQDMPTGLTSEDSLLYRNNYIKMWEQELLDFQKDPHKHSEIL